MSRRGLTAGVLAIAFVLGGMEGALGYGLYQIWQGWLIPTRAGRIPSGDLWRVIREIGLRPEQQEQVAAILAEASREEGRLLSEIGPQFRDQWARARDRIRRMLDARQQARFDSLPVEAGTWAGRWPGARGVPAAHILRAGRMLDDLRPN